MQAEQEATEEQLEHEKFCHTWLKEALLTENCFGKHFERRIQRKRMLRKGPASLVCWKTLALGQSAKRFRHALFESVVGFR